METTQFYEKIPMFVIKASYYSKVLNCFFPWQAPLENAILVQLGNRSHSFPTWPPVGVHLEISRLEYFNSIENLMD